MKCPYCNAEIRDTAIFCEICGQNTKAPRQAPQSPTPPQQSFMQPYSSVPSIQTPQQKVSNKIPIFIFLTAVIAAVLICIIYIPKTTNGNNNIIPRKATNTDVEINVNDDFSLSIQIEVKPKINITNLQITFEFANESNTVLTTKTKTLGDVTKGTTYSITFSLTEFTLNQIFAIENVRAKVTNGTV